MAGFDVAEARRVLETAVAPWVRATGCVVEAVTGETVTLRLPYSPEKANAHGLLSAPSLIAGADIAMTLAIAAASGGYRLVRPMDHTVNYVAPVDGQDVVLTARVVRLGKSIAFATVEMKAAGAVVAAFASGTYALG